ncbi:bifunctional hydroxymethylpyrimidine kinase/phosphomethylpyrimidine kinase [Halococcoides cellulosivorans]|uniref:Bifunctional hydroxymethylpyrimidine kinase/phosphomethylpyrimidine kinase n=1 Tax=Halococcoides cellulosivorans TaxID=1679096 RepID=A0A2R4WZ20_9EURY|nr:bifunctional hydroxymethylpyrimidine kinase/phosphomethylpyrimidine kinase [Halococcoides cellulosivorans]AWB26776.1 bifunctional hydroxymethylpyrimidine kinase/phosphomethylpyrimidine kinase [Halococcoides cellulosivorans]
MSIEPDPADRPVTLTIAGSDSGGGAGIQADLKTMEAVGAFATSAITNVTAQNTTGVDGVHPVPTDAIREQIAAVREDFDVRAVKTGMLGTDAVIETVRAAAGDCDPLVVDPVMIAASGDRLLDEEAEDAYEGLIGAATLVTPNCEEAHVLTGVEVTDDASAERAGAALRAMGADAALITGGHRGGETVRDVLVTAEGVETIVHPRVTTDATHGSGCSISSAIAARLAQGASLDRAVRDGVELLARAVRYHHSGGAGPGAVHHLAALRNQAERSGTVESAAGLYGRVADRASAALVATPFANDQDDIVAVGAGGPLTDPAAAILLGLRDRAPGLAAAVRVPDASGDWPSIDPDRSASDRRDAARSIVDESGQPDVLALDEDALVVGPDPAAVIDRLDAI